MASTKKAVQPKAAANPKIKTPKGVPRPKHVPQRTCIACRSSDAKRELLRVVRTPEGQVEVDPTGKRVGRGAYICKNRECWTTGLAKKALDNALKITLDPETRAKLKEYGDGLPERSPIEVE